MADDLRQRVRFAAFMTILGLMADLAYVQIEAAVRFALIHRWPEMVTYFILGATTMAVAVRGALGALTEL